MNQIRKYITPRRTDLLAPLVVVFSTLVNIAFYYLGLAYVETTARSYGFIVANVLFAVVCGLALLAYLRQFHFPVITWILLGAVPVLFAVWFLIGLSRYGLHPSVVDYLEQFIVFCLPAFFCGILMAFRRADACFFQKLESISFFALPAGVIYLNGMLFRGLPDVFNYGTSLGTLNYMTLAYTFMPFLFAHFICFIEKEPLAVPLVGRSFRHPQAVRFCMAAVYWLDIIATGTRGAYVCVLGFIALVFLSRLICREPVRQPLKIFTPLILIFLFLLFIYTPPQLERIHRLDVFLSGLQEGTITTTTGGAGDSEVLDELVTIDVPLVGEATATPAPTPAAVEDTPAVAENTPAEDENTPAEGENTPAEGENAPAGDTAVTPDAGLAAAEPTAEPTAEPAPATLEPAPTPVPENDAAAGESALPDISQEEYHISDRGTLFSLALKEFKKSPWTGMGPMGYTIKYGGYPHNLFLEMLCELGLAGSIPMVLIICLAMWNILRAAWKDKAARYMVAFLGAYVLQTCISGSFWTDKMFLFALGYGLALPRKRPPAQTPVCRIPKE